MVKSRLIGLASLIIFNVSAFCLMAAELPKASAERLEKRIIDLSQFGRNADGGVDRVAFSDANVEGHKFMVSLMKASGLDVSVDPAGNIIGKRAGKNPALAPILFGSHIDSVPGGGNYDGDVGVMAALEVMDLLNSANIVTDHPLEMLVFTAEESSMIGSRSFSGDLPERTIKEFTTPGTMRTDGLDRLGGDHTKLQQAKPIEKEMHYVAASNMAFSRNQAIIPHGMVARASPNNIEKISAKKYFPPVWLWST